MMEKMGIRLAGALALLMWIPVDAKAVQSAGAGGVSEIPVVPEFADGLAAINMVAVPGVNLGGLSEFAVGRGLFRSPVAIFPEAAQFSAGVKIRHTPTVRAFMAHPGNHMVLGPRAGGMVVVAPTAQVLERQHPLLFLRPDGSHQVVRAGIEAARGAAAPMSQGDSGVSATFAAMQALYDGSNRFEDAAVVPVAAGPLAWDSPERDRPLLERFVVVRGRQYRMGSPEDEAGRNYFTEMQREVEVQSFKIAQMVTTQGEYYAVMNPEKLQDLSDERRHRPMTGVTLYDSMLYAREVALQNGLAPFYELTNIEKDASGHIVKATIRTLGGRGPRLLSEEEWELAARGADHAESTPFPFPADQLDDYAVHAGNSGRGVGLVATRRPINGVYDMHGLVYEWTASVESVAGRVEWIARGGSYGRTARNLRSAHREIFYPGYRENDVGLRLAMSVGPPDT